MEEKRLKENNKTHKMSPTEYSMNYKILEKVSETITVIMAIIGIYLVGGKLFTMANKEDEDKEEII